MCKWKKFQKGNLFNPEGKWYTPRFWNLREVKCFQEKRSTFGKIIFTKLIWWIKLSLILAIFCPSMWKPQYIYVTSCSNTKRNEYTSLISFNYNYYKSYWEKQILRHRSLCNFRWVQMCLLSSQNYIWNALAFTCQ